MNQAVENATWVPPPPRTERERERQGEPAPPRLGMPRRSAEVSRRRQGCHAGGHAARTAHVTARIPPLCLGAHSCTGPTAATSP
jgi:hypothetical protein